MTTATGGFVFRAERGTLEIKTTSEQHIGPGSYALPSSINTQPGGSNVPFLSGAERILMDNPSTSGTTPGPGAYQAAKALDASQKRRGESINYSAPFASCTARLHTDKTHRGMPGPGTYTAGGNAWLKHQHRYSAPANQQRVSYSRVASAPSIPYRHQCYGYEEGNKGALVMQPPPDPVHTGVGRDTVGPGSYDLARTSVEKPRAVQFGKSHTRRGLQVSSDTPGPGAYNPAKTGKTNTNGIVVNIGGVDVQFGGASGTSQFASKVPLPSQKQVQEWERTPGPGAYNLHQPLGAAPAPPEHQFFGTTARRASDIDPMKSLSAPSYYHTPGPAAYHVPPQGIRIMQQSMADPRPFNATSTRFTAHASSVPGPGEYRPDLQDNLAKSIQDKAAISKGGVFGTVAKRFSEDTRAKTLPGPGTYTAEVDSPKPVHRGNDTAFASKTKRFQPAKAGPTALDTTDAVLAVGTPDASRVRGDPSRLGPGSYNLPDQWKTKGGKHVLATGVPAFGSNANRSDAARMYGTASNNPGPGRYDTLKNPASGFKPLTHAAPENVFGSQVRRFKDSASFTPGPGHYSLGAGLAKKSFNVTYGAA